LACLAGVAAVVLAANSAERPAGSPLDASGVWRAVLIAGVVLAFLAYVVGVLRSSVGGVKRLVLLIAVAIQLVPLFSPLLLSTDAYSYWAYGRVAAVHDENPYVATPDRHPADPAVTRMGADWRDDALVYGPVFAAVAEVGARVSGDSAVLGALFHRLLATAAMVGMICIAYSLAGASALPVVLIGWNPLLALHAAGGGHNDFLMMALALLGYAFALRSKSGRAAVLWGLAIAVKWTAGLLLPLLILQLRLWRNRRFIVGAVSTAVVIGGLATLRYGPDWLGAVERLSAQGRRTDGSLGLAPLLGDLGLSHRATLATLAALLLVGYAWCMVDSYRWLPRLSRGGEVIVLTQGWVNPWYAAVFMPFVAVERDVLARWVALAATAYFLWDVVA
jgi:Glycosyltransferase family 87